jgi:hypothetical protein
MIAPATRMMLMSSLVASLFAAGCKGCADDEKGADEVPVADTDDPSAANDRGAWLSMGATADGRVVVAYEDRTAKALGVSFGTIGADGAVTWAHEQVDGYADETGLDPGDRGRYASLAVAADGTVWVAHQDVTNGALRYARRAPDGVWTSGVADTGGGSRPNAGLWASLALDPSGNPVIAHYDAGKGDLRVARWNGSAFSGTVAFEGPDVTAEDGTILPGDAGSYARLRITPTGDEYIAFYDAALGALRLATGGASGWSVEVVDDNGNVGQWPDMAIDGVRVSLLYHDVTNGDLKLAAGAPGAWELSIADNGDMVGADVAMWTADGSIGAVYHDANNNDMRAATRAGDAWTNRLVTGTDAAHGFHNETVTIAGTRYAACYDYSAREIWFGAL